MIRVKENKVLLELQSENYFIKIDWNKSWQIAFTVDSIFLIYHRQQTRSVVMLLKKREDDFVFFFSNHANVYFMEKKFSFDTGFPSWQLLQIVSLQLWQLLFRPIFNEKRPTPGECQSCGPSCMPFVNHLRAMGCFMIHNESWNKPVLVLSWLMILYKQLTYGLAWFHGKNLPVSVRYFLLIHLASCSSYHTELTQ